MPSLCFNFLICVAMSFKSVPPRSNNNNNNNKDNITLILSYQNNDIFNIIILQDLWIWDSLK